MTVLDRTCGRAPRLVFRVLGFSFAVIVVVLAAVLLLLSWQTRSRLTRAVVENLEASQLRFANLEERRQRQQRLQAAALAENPTLKAAVDTYYAERTLGGSTSQLRGTIQGELAKLQQTMDVPVLTVTDVRGAILASAGPRALDWLSGDLVPRVGVVADVTSDAVIVRGTRPYLATIVPLLLGGEQVGTLVLASPLDDAYARELASEARTDVAIRIDGHLVASSSALDLRKTLERLALPESGTVNIGNDEFVVRRLMAVDTAHIYALASATRPVRAATSEAAWVLLAVGVGALMLAGAGSWWLARTLASPIDQLRLTLADMAAARDFERPLPQGGTSYELDALAETFDRLRAAVSMAEAESEATYLGVIGALATALDARDPYTAGHSERVATLSVAIARELEIPEAEVETLRLGALLHDIGKIGVSDAVLRKPGTLTDEEFEQIKLHPTLGARILKPLHFLPEHIAVVELHHEQPDGHGYPFGLVGDAIPLFARIVHVADAFDAMTTARAYRPGRPVTEAMAELWRHAGTGFDLTVVQAMAKIPASLLARPVAPREARPGELVGGALVPFRIRAAGAMRRTAS